MSAHDPADLACSQPASLSDRFDPNARCPVCRGEQTEAESERQRERTEHEALMDAESAQVERPRFCRAPIFPRTKPTVCGLPEGHNGHHGYLSMSRGWLLDPSASKVITSDLGLS